MRRAAQRIVEKLRLHGHEAFFAGGWVRDFLLRRKPKDIDIATSALPENVLRIFPRAMPIGAQFGVVQVRLYGHAYDVATFRSEGPYLDGRHPSSVSFSGPQQDALRRDFTVNGLFYDPIADRVIDYVSGAADIRRRILRTIGKPQERFREDKLRMLRAVRFSCSLDFKIAPETFQAIRQLAPSILEVSWERIRDELLKILTGPLPGRGLELLHETRLLTQILPEVEAMRGITQPTEFHPEGDVFVHTRNALELLHNPAPALALAVLLHDVGKPPTFAVKERIRFDRHVEVGARIAEEICRRLRMSNQDIELVVELVEDHLRFMNIHKMRPSTLKRFLRRPDFETHLELHRVDCLSSHGSLDSYLFARKKHEELKQEPAPPPRLISGDDLIDMGYLPGPLFRQILEGVEDLQLENPQLTREQALQHVRQAFPLEKPTG
ncbi:MAG: CCA tRNA nucleotidyltransferase [Acidobacteriia bacterium]|nr:CCA tRNA nucleotidyltransferase [Terriglobia bacterium]